MSERLTAGFWVSAYLNRLRLADIPVYVTAKGDATAGAVVVKSATLDGRARAFQRSFDLVSGGRAWVVGQRPRWTPCCPANARATQICG